MDPCWAASTLRKANSIDDTVIIRLHCYRIRQTMRKVFTDMASNRLPASATIVRTSVQESNNQINFTGRQILVENITY